MASLTPETTPSPSGATKDLTLVASIEFPKVVKDMEIALNLVVLEILFS